MNAPDPQAQPRDESDLPPKVTSTLQALALVTAFADHAQAHRERAESILYQIFMVVFDALAAHPVSPPQASALMFLHEYFKHRGSWSDMRQCLETSVLSLSGRSLDEVRAYCNALNDKAQLFRAEAGGA